MDRPWMKWWTREWLDYKELRRCSLASRAVFADLKCLASEGHPYAYLADEVGALTIGYMANRFMISTGQLTKSVAELIDARILAKNPDGILFIPVMEHEEKVRLARASGGTKGGNPQLLGKHPTPRKDNLTSQPKVIQEVNQPMTLTLDVGFPSRSLSRKTERPAAPDAQVFWDWLKPWERCADPNSALQAWLSVVDTPEIEAAAFAARDRYLASDEVSRNAIMEPGKWLFAQSSANWQGRWPTPLNGARKVPTRLERADPTVEEDAAALQWISEHDPDPVARKEAAVAIARRKRA